MTSRKTMIKNTISYNLSHFGMVSLTYFMPLLSFCNARYTRKPEVFWCFQVVWKETSGMKWIKKILICMLSGSMTFHVNNTEKSIHQKQFPIFSWRKTFTCIQCLYLIIYFAITWSSSAWEPITKGFWNQIIPGYNSADELELIGKMKSP